MPLGQRRRKAATAKRACSNCEEPLHRRLPNPARTRPPWPHLPRVRRLTPASLSILARLWAVVDLRSDRRVRDELTDLLSTAASEGGFCGPPPRPPRVGALG